MAAPRTPEAATPFDVIIVGAGFAGLYALHKLRSLGFRTKIFEAGDGVGGTWYWNRYPGARCDVQSLVYCYTFDEALYREWTWSERFATQPEIRRYLDFVADRLDLRKDIVFESPITEAIFDEARKNWTLASAHGERAKAPYVIMATGALSASRLPGVEGLESFRGEHYHTGQWPHHKVSFKGKRVGVIGTGSSGVQIIPLIAEEAAHLTVFQRTPSYVAPARNTAITPEEYETMHRNFATYRERLRMGKLIGAGDLIISDHLPGTKPRAADVPPEEREALMQARWAVGSLAVGSAFADTMKDIVANTAVGDFLRARIREIVKDPKRAAILSPMDYPWGAKRVCVGTHYYETFNRANVSLVDCRRTPIEAFTPSGLRTTEQAFDFDMIVLATGFDALTGALTRIDIRGRNGLSLRRLWDEEGPETYLGIGIAEFPNLLMVNGPGSQAILGNVVAGIEQHVDWIVDLLSHVREHDIATIEADSEAQQKWTEHVTDAAYETLHVKGHNWWMNDKTRPGKRPAFLPYIRGLGAYREICDDVAHNGYRGFRLSGAEGR